MASQKVIGGADPARANKFLVELFKPLHVVLLICALASVLLGSMFMTLFAPEPWTEIAKNHGLKGQGLVDFCKNNVTLYQETPRLTGLNQDFFVYFSLEYRRFVDRSLRKTDLVVGVSLESREIDGQDWEPISSANLVRQLSCSQYSQFCDRIIISREPNIRHNFYRIGIQLFNAGTLFDEGYFGDLRSLVIMTKTAASIYETFWRGVCLLANSGIIVYFVIMLAVTRTNILKAPVEQQMTWILMWALILFNNPLFLLNVTLNWIFILPLLNQVFISTFIAVFLYFVLVLLHATILQKPGRRSFFGFYLFKIILVFCMWLTNVVSRSWIQIAGLYDPTQMLFAGDAGILSSSVMGAIGITSFLLLLIYAFCVLYLLFRAVGKATRNQFKHLDIRFKMIWAITLAALVSAIGFGLFLFVAGFENAIAFVFYWTLFNVYVAFCAIIYSPTKAKYTPWEVQEHIEQAAAAKAPNPDQQDASTLPPHTEESDLPDTSTYETAHRDNDEQHPDDIAEEQPQQQTLDDGPSMRNFD